MPADRPLPRVIASRADRPLSAQLDYSRPHARMTGIGPSVGGEYRHVEIDIEGISVVVVHGDQALRCNVAGTRIELPKFRDRDGTWGSALELRAVGTPDDEGKAGLTTAT